MSDRFTPQIVLDYIAEVRRLNDQLAGYAGPVLDFLFVWIERHGGLPVTLADKRQLFSDSVSAIPEITKIQELLLEQLQAWQIQHGKMIRSIDDLHDLDAKTGLLTKYANDLGGLTQVPRWAFLCSELSRAAVQFHCDDSVAAALKSISSFLSDLMAGRASLSSPATWTDARLQANQLSQSEAIAGIPLHQAWPVALDKLELVAKGKLVMASAPVTKGMTWQKAKSIAENHCKRNPFPGVNALAKLAGCSASTMSKAIDHSKKLRDMLVQHENRRRSVSASYLNSATMDAIAQGREIDPVNAVSASTDDIFQRLIEQATPQERAKLHAMPPDKRRELVATIENDHGN